MVLPVAVSTAAQSLPTVAQPPRMPFTFAVVVVMPLVALRAPPGRENATVPPVTVRVMAPRFTRVAGVPVTALFRVTAEPPALTVRPFTAWEVAVLALAVTWKVPPPRTRAEPLLIRL